MNNKTGTTRSKEPETEYKTVQEEVVEEAEWRVVKNEHDARNENKLNNIVSPRKDPLTKIR